MRANYWTYCWGKSPKDVAIYLPSLMCTAEAATCFAVSPDLNSGEVTPLPVEPMGKI